MNIVVDTSVWSLVLRRRRVRGGDPSVQAFRGHVEAGNALFLVGPILQELLDGVRTRREFGRLLDILEPFPLLPLERSTFVLAAQIRTACRRRGVQVAPVDCQIAAACVEHGFPLLTADRDFLRIAKHCELILLPPLVNGGPRHK